MNHGRGLRIATIILICFSRLSHSIKCYRCSPVAMTVINPKDTIGLCSQFDYSERFIVNCPYSTLCMKKTYSVNLTNGTLRDCASQKYEYQKYDNGKWHLEVSIEEEPYKEGCLVTDDKGFKISSSTYCYCRGDLCNSSIKNAQFPLVLLFVTVILSFNCISFYKW